MARIGFIFAVLFLSFPASSCGRQVFRDSLVVYYAEGRTDIDMGLLNNRANISSFLRRYDAIRQYHSTVIRSFKFAAFASPTSSLQANINIAKKRSQKLYEFFRARIGLPESVVEVTSHDVDWFGLRQQVENSDMPHKYEVLCILALPAKKVSDSKGRRVDHRKLMLMKLHGGMTWRYLYEHFFQAMRYARVCLHFEMECETVPVIKSPKVPQTNQKPAPTMSSSLPLNKKVVERSLQKMPPEVTASTVAPVTVSSVSEPSPVALIAAPHKKSRFYGFVGEKKVFFADSLPVRKTVQPVSQPISKPIKESVQQPFQKKEIRTVLVDQQPSQEPKAYEYRRYFALKTNVFFDALSLLNAELEFPVSRQWSVMGEYMFPWWWYNYKRNTWWLWNQGQTAVEIISGTLETRYWFDQENPRKAFTPLKGWFVGGFGGGGYYDLEANKKGYQGEFWMAGLSAGYVKPLSRHWLLEFSFSAGYLHTDYRYYNAVWGDIDHRFHLIRQSNGSTSWLGPLKAKVSLVWYPLFRKRVKEKGGEE